MIVKMALVFKDGVAVHTLPDAAHLMLLKQDDNEVALFYNVRESARPTCVRRTYHAFETGQSVPRHFTYVASIIDRQSPRFGGLEDFHVFESQPAYMLEDGSFRPVPVGRRIVGVTNSYL